MFTDQLTSSCGQQGDTHCMSLWNEHTTNIQQFAKRCNSRVSGSCNCFIALNVSVQRKCHNFSMLLMILLYFKWITINVEYINRITNVCQWHEQLNAGNKYFGQTMPLNDITHQAMQTSSYCFHVLRLWSNIYLPFQRICTSYSQIMDMWNKSNRLEKSSIWWMLWQTSLQR